MLVVVARPVFWSIAMGTCSTMLWVLKPATASRAALGFCGPPENWLRKLPRSKAPPRSTKNGSSRGPANTFSPVEAVVMAALTRAS